MTQSTESLSFSSRLGLRWKLFLRWVLHWWVKAQVLPDIEGQTGVEPGQPVCYLLSDYALSSVLILDRVCEDLQRDRPLLPITSLEDLENRAFAALRRKQGIIIRRPSTRRNSEVLKRLVEYSHENTDLDIQLVPVTVLVGRAPDSSTGVAKALFAENWEVGGRLRRLFGTMINGRDTMVQFSRPISLRQMTDEGLGASRCLRKISRILRTHFRRVKTAVIGPDLSHRRMLAASVVKAPIVREAIIDKARREGISEAKATALANKYVMEIAANYSYSFVRIAFFFLDWFLNRLFGEPKVQHFDRFKQHALDHEIIYVPCHRSHADYLLMSYVLYTRGFVSPHIAAGINLNLPLVGSLVRRGGGFYLRRSFKSQKLYAAVFSEYVSHILSHGVSIEYFIEGTRSRTGRLLPPKGGMVAMTVRSYLRAPVLPIMFQPVYIGYEQLLEGSSYTRELSGAAKKKESLGDLFKVFGILRKHHGNVHVSFGEPIFLNNLLDQADPEWRNTSTGTDDKPAWLTPLVNDIGDQVMRNINAAADVNPINFLATILLATPKHTLGEKELLEQIDLCKELLKTDYLGDLVTMTDLDARAIVEYGTGLGLISRIEHPLGDIIQIHPDHAVRLTYFRNNSAHLFAIPSLLACCLQPRRRIEMSTLRRVVSNVFPFIHTELFFPWPLEKRDELLNQCLVSMQELGLLTVDEAGEMIQRAPGGSAAAGQLTVLARSLLPTVERYYITIAVLAKNGSGTLSRKELERLCLLTAQRISMLNEFNAPEFHDAVLFRQFIGELKRQDMLVNIDGDKLEFGDQLGSMDQDARLMLDKELRHGIFQVAPQLLEQDPD